MTREEVGQLCELLSRLDREQWRAVERVVDGAFESAMRDFYDAHREEWEAHGKAPGWFSERLATLARD